MKDAKKTLLIAGIICLVASLVYVVDIFLDIYVFEYDLYYLITDIISFVLSVGTGTAYLVLREKDTDTLIKIRWVFIVLMLLNIFNGLIVWAVSFWVELVVGNLQRRRYFSNVRYHGGDTENPEETVIIEPADYETTSKIDELKEEIRKLDEMKRKKIITEEEYDKLKKSLIEKFY